MTIVRGRVKKRIGSEIEEPVKLTITGLDSKGVRLNSAFADLDYLEFGKTEDFVITVPKNGKEKTFLFTYEYDFYVDGGSGADVLAGWFEDAPHPSFIPKIVYSPPQYKDGIMGLFE